MKNTPTQTSETPLQLGNEIARYLSGDCGWHSFLRTN